MAQIYDPITGGYKEQTAPKSVSFGFDDPSMLPKPQATTPTKTTSVSNTSVSTPASSGYTQINKTGIVKKGTALDANLPGVGSTTTPTNTDDLYKNPVLPKSETVPITSDSLITGGEVTAEQKLQYEKEAMQNDQLNKDLLGASKTVEQAQAEKDYQNKQEQNRVQREGLQVQNAEIASSQRIQQAGKQLDNLRQNIAYIGNMGRPAKSMVQLDAMKNQVSTAEQTFRELVQVEDNLKTIQKLGVEYNAQAFEKQMSDLQDKLDTQVSTTLQGVITDFNKEAQGIDTMDELNALREKWLDTVDTSLEDITNRNFIDRQNRITQFQQIIADKKVEITYQRGKEAEYIKNSNTVNKEMSTAKGYYTDGNGNAIVGVDGKMVPHAKDAPEDAIFDKASGKLFTSSLGPNGETIWNSTQVVDQPQFSAQVIQSMITAVQRGTMTTAQALEVLPPDAQQQFLSQVGSIKPEAQQYAPKGWSKLDDGSLYNQDTGEIRTASGATGNTTVQTNPQSIVDFSINKRGRTNLQCGELVNDYIYNITGKDPSGAVRLGNTYNSKITALTNIGLSNGPVEGGLFVSNPLNNNVGHTGIVQSVNTDGSITVLEANASGKASGEAPTTKIYTNTSGMTFSQAPQAKVSLTKEEKSTLFSIQDDLKADPRRKEYLTLQSKIKTLDGIKTRLDTGKATAQDKQQLISDFAKVLDPTSVVREGEYALAAKYGQSAINKTIQDISNWYSTNGPISDTSAKVLAEAVGLRFEATQQANNEAVEEQKGRAEIFLGRPVSYEELAVTSNKSPTPVQSNQQQSNIPASIANPVASKPSSQANADYLKSLGITQ